MDGALLDGRIRRRGPDAISRLGMMLLVGGRCGTQLGMKSSIDVGRSKRLESKCAPNALAQRLEPLESDMTLGIDGAQ